MSYAQRLLFLAALTAGPAVAQAQEDEPPAFDAEHIFGFAEGSDIGAKGEREIESTTIGGFGASAGGYASVDSEISFRYGVTDELRLSVGAVADYFNIHDAPGFGDRSAATFSGVTAEARWNILDRRTAPFGMTLSFDPEWRRIEENTGASARDFGVSAALLVDQEIIPQRLFTVLNLIYSPSLFRLDGRWGHDDSFTVIAGGSYALAPNLFFGGEIRRENLAQNGNLNAHALYVGPQLFVRVSESFTGKIAWATQVADFGARSLDLANFPRDQVKLEFSFNF